MLAFLACSAPIAEAPPDDQAQVVSAAEFDSPIDPSVRPEDLPIPPVPTTAEIEAFHARVRRVSPKEFPDLPAALSKALIERGCLVPQASSSGPLGNVIRGEFFAAGQESWAVVCSRNRKAQILAFRSASDAQPAVVEERDEQVCMGEEWNCGMLYGTNIHPVGGDYIVNHYEAYGGPVPPPIDHQGINVGIWDKASVVRYLHEGKWLTLTGAD